MIGTVLYNIEVTRVRRSACGEFVRRFSSSPSDQVKREKEGRSGSITGPPEEVAPIERKRTITEDNEVWEESVSLP